jgi:hypothetical protein
MYKNRITKWKLDKRNKEPEMMAVVRKKCQRDAVGKASEFHIRGRLVDLDNVHHYLKRKGMSIENAIELSAATPPELRCSTPDAVPRSPVNPEIFEGPQRVFTEIRHYIFGSLDSKTWFVGPNEEVYWSVAGMGVIDDFFFSLQTACDLLSAGSYNRAGQFLVKGSALIRDLLLEENPRTLDTVFEVMMMMQRNGWADCSNIIFKQFSRMAVTTFPEMHPLRQIFTHMQPLGPELAEDFLAAVWESFVDICEEALDALSSTVLQIRLDYISVIESARNPDRADAQLHIMVERCREAYGKVDNRYTEATGALATFLYNYGRYREAAAAAEEVICCASVRKCGYTWCRGMELLARSQYGNFDDEQAESTLRQAIDVCNSSWGWEHGWTLRLLTLLGAWLTKFGKHEEAAEVSEHIAEILRQSTAFV